ncbi:MAG: DUF1850 domain-containing protein [Rhodocyclales bacterium]|nr:DUF1850 domain-containing protein [Rhodocyclales bacterium]
MPLCLAAGAVTAALAVESFTLAWTHSIEKLRWEEDWRIEAKTLVITEARIRGTGAGMEPPADAVLKEGIWHYRPAVKPLTNLRLSHSPYTVGYELCIEGECRPLAEHLPGAENLTTIVLEACP